MEGVCRVCREGIQWTPGILSVIIMVLMGEIHAYTQHKILWTTDDILFTQPLQPTVRATMGDAADFLCPRISPAQDVFTNNVKEDLFMKDFSIYKVSEEDYKNCSLTSRDEILRCNRPTSTKMFTIDIVQYNAIPGSIEFKCGQQHYFIAKERGPSRVSTMCRQYNTRLRMNITCSPSQEMPMLPPRRKSTSRPVVTELLMDTAAPPADNRRNFYIIVGAGACFIFITSIIIITLIVIMLFRSKKEREEQRRKESLKNKITVVRNPPLPQHPPLPPTPQHQYDMPHYYTIENLQDDSNSSGIYSYISE